MKIRRWLDPWRARREQEEDLARGLDTHLAIASDEQQERGFSPVDAQHAAHKQLGNVTLLKEEMREMWGSMWLDRLVQDARNALRTMLNTPGFAAITICTLAIGIGANTAIFSVVDHIMFRPFAYQHPEQLAAVHEVVHYSGATRAVPVNLAHFQEWRRNWRAAERIAVIGGLRMSLTGRGEPERLQTMRVSANLFSLLGVQPQLGRSFSPEEDQLGRDHIVLLSDDLWRRRFNGDPNVLGRTIALNDEPYEIIGVLPPFSFPKISELFPISIATSSSPELWKPLGAVSLELDGSYGYNFACIVRLKPGISVAQARSTLNALQETATPRPPGSILQADLVPLTDQVAGRVRTGVTLVWAAVAAVLLIGCVNMANLLLARTLSRRREMAIRAAIGASRWRLMRQVLVESLLTSAIGGGVGVLAAYWVLHLIVSTAPADLPRVNEIQIDAPVLTFSLCVSLLAGILVGVLPAWRLGGLNPLDALKSGSVSVTSTRTTGRLRALLVACQVGVSAMCLISGGLLLHSFWKLLRVDAGFAANRVLTVDVSLPVQRYPTSVSRSTFIRTALDRMQALPGVVAAGVSNKLPLTGEGGNGALWPERSTAVSESILGDLRPVNPDYFAAMGISLRTGRPFAESDRDRAIAVVSAVAAERLWPGEDPIGKRFHTGTPSRPAIEVVGVVGDVHGVSLDRPPSPTVYVPYWQSGPPPGVRSWDLILAARTEAEPINHSSSLRALIRDLDPELAVTGFRTMDDVVSDSLGQRRFQMVLVLLFAAAATLLASVGLYGVVSYAVGQRTNEIGIRLALGALPADIRRLVVTQGFTPVVIGLGTGMLASAGLGRLLGSLLFGVTPTDPLTLAVVVVVFVTVALAAMYVPTQRAARVDPLQTLRQD